MYSLAMTFYSMLALKPPYTGEPGAKERIVNGIPPSVDPSWHPDFMEVGRFLPVRQDDTINDKNGISHRAVSYTARRTTY